MAATLRNSTSSAFRVLRLSNLTGASKRSGFMSFQNNQSIVELSRYPNFAQSTRFYSSSSKVLNNIATSQTNPSEGGVADEPEPGQIFLHKRHNVYVAWHPEVPFPYEMTKPIDITAPITDSHMKIQAITPVKEAFRQKYHNLVVRELIRITYSTKHRFFGRFGMSKRHFLRYNQPNKELRLRKYL